MQAARDSDWLAGEERWYPASESVPESLVGEVNPPESWSVTGHREGGRGWIRQRLQPLGPMILYTTSWAPFFLLASLAPLVFPGNTPDDQNVALALFAISWLLLFVPFSKLRDGLENRARTNPLDLYPFEGGLMLLGSLLFLLHVMIDPRIGGIAFAFFAYVQYRTIGNITVSAGHNSARWLLPIESSDFSKDILAQGWVGVSAGFRNGPLAQWHGPLPEYAADLTGVTRGDSTFVAFTLKHRGGTVHDPFSEKLVAKQAFTDLFASPPLVIAGEAWPERFIAPSEQ